MKWHATFALIALFVFVIAFMVPGVQAAPACSTADATARLGQEPELYMIAGQLGIDPNRVACDKLAWDYNFGLQNEYAENDPRWVSSFWDRLNAYAHYAGTLQPFASNTIYTFPYTLRMPTYRRLYGVVP